MAYLQGECACPRAEEEEEEEEGEEEEEEEEEGEEKDEEEEEEGEEEEGKAEGQEEDGEEDGPSGSAPSRSSGAGHELPCPQKSSAHTQWSALRSSSQGLTCAHVQAQLEDVRDTSLTLVLNLSTFGTHPRVVLGKK